METKDVRRARKLCLLIDAIPGGMRAVAVASQSSPGYLKQIAQGVLLPIKKDGTRSARALGDSVAESIEDAYGLGRGWFDSPRGLPSDVCSDHLGVLPDEYARLGTQSQRLVREMIRHLLAVENNQKILPSTD